MRRNLWPFWLWDFDCSSKVTLMHAVTWSHVGKKNYCSLIKQMSLRVSFQDPMHNLVHILRQDQLLCFGLKEYKIIHVPVRHWEACWEHGVHSRRQFPNPCSFAMTYSLAHAPIEVPYRCKHAWILTHKIPPLFWRGSLIWTLVVFVPSDSCTHYSTSPGFSHSCPKPSVSSMANISFSFSCS